MAVDTNAWDHALGAIGTTFRLTRLYPATHPAVLEALRQVTATLPAIAAQGPVEWKVGATGLHWQHHQLLPRNGQLAELAGLLYARGVRVVGLHPGVTADHILALFGVATGGVPPDDPALGRVTLSLGRRGSVRLPRAAGAADPVAATPPVAPLLPLAPRRRRPRRPRRPPRPLRSLRLLLPRRRRRRRRRSLRGSAVGCSVRGEAWCSARMFCRRM